MRLNPIMQMLLMATGLSIGSISLPTHAQEHQHAETAQQPQDWQEGKTYTTGDIARYEGRTYRALATHTAHIGANWNPLATPGLWQLIDTAAPQPTPSPVNISGRHVLQSVSANKCVAVEGASTANAAKLQLRTCNSTAAQSFEISQTTSGQYRILNSNSQKSWDVSGRKTTPGAGLTQWTDNGGAHQRFQFVAQGANYTIRAAHSGLCIEAGPGHDGTQLTQAACHGGVSQQFALKPAQTPTPTPTPSGTPVERHGQLRVCSDNLHLCNERNETVQLRGMSSHGIQWYGWGKCLTAGSLDALAKDWKADLLRISMYIQEDGYETDPAGFTAQVERLIDEATKRGMYALIDWHQLSPGDPNHNLAHAKTFFSHIAKKYGGQKNIIYDVANEPNGVSWSQIREYGEKIIPVIRAIDPDALILIGTHGWGSFGVSDGRSAQDIVDDPVRYRNIMYTFHFYAGEHGETYLNALKWGAARLPVFVTEWGTQQASGDGPNDFTMAQKYLDFMAQHKISWANWNYSDDFRSGAVWKTGTCSRGDWSANTLKPAGEFVRRAIQQR
ncbi:endoglucanase [Chitinivorax tropicus]|uniref:Endoglucanase n=1 Tax=Chitinivorax tropicus TaxID=714531 RepID=A0A840MGA7_9PROT|nr:cellulase family glycosylhydrolase [Chitinivorax tropicus]MBB5018274.1 endoglucanase [Chitinivorax tropicus]